MSNDRALRTLMRRIAGVERKIDAALTTPRLRNSSLEGGSIVVNDEQGQPQVIIGEQADGTTMVNHVSGPPPPTPTAPTLSAALGFVDITWDGLFVDDAMVPMDFSRVEVHRGDTADFNADVATTLVNTIESPRGGTVAVGVGYEQDSHFKLVARSLSGKASVASAVVSGRARKVASVDIEPFTIQPANIADFALVATKFRTTQHIIL